MRCTACGEEMRVWESYADTALWKCDNCGQWEEELIDDEEFEEQPRRVRERDWK